MFFAITVIKTVCRISSKVAITSGVFKIIFQAVMVKMYILEIFICTYMCISVTFTYIFLKIWLLTN